MIENEKTAYDILWYLNEYPNEVNATDEIIRNSLKMTKHDFDKAKDNLITKSYIIKRGDNNSAWKINEDGKIEFRRLNEIRVSELENRQSRMEYNMFYVNLTIAIGTSVAAVYYLIEIVKMFYSCN